MNPCQSQDGFVESFRNPSAPNCSHCHQPDNAIFLRKPAPQRGQCPEATTARVSSWARWIRAFDSRLRRLVSAAFCARVISVPPSVLETYLRFVRYLERPRSTDNACTSCSRPHRAHSFSIPLPGTGTQRSPSSVYSRVSTTRMIRTISIIAAIPATHHMDREKRPTKYAQIAGAFVGRERSPIPNTIPEKIVPPHPGLFRCDQASVLTRWM